jgi:hypothetical protein
MLRFLTVLAVLIPQVAFASTWDGLVPDAYGNRRLATAEELKAFETARECKGKARGGMPIRVVDSGDFAVFVTDKDGKVYRVFYADAEYYDRHMCWPR